MKLRALGQFGGQFRSLLVSLSALLVSALMARADIAPIALDGQLDPRGQPYSTTLHAFGLSKTGSVIFYPENFLFPPSALYRHTPGLRDGVTDSQTVGPDGATFSGKFPSTIAGKAVKVSFQGVVLQKQNTATGYFKGDAATGSFKLDAK